MNTAFHDWTQSNWLFDVWRGHRGLVISFTLLCVSLLAWKIHGGETVFPQRLIDSFQFSDTVNEFDKWIRPYIQPTTRLIASWVVWLYDLMSEFLIDTQWQVVFVVLILPAFAYGGLRLGLLAIVAVSSWLIMDFWEEAMETLSLMSISILISVVIGVLMGIASSQSDRVEAIFRPVLDTMQTLPAFVYLIPAFYLFGIGPPGAILATVIYALPPMVRLTNLGIRHVPSEINDAATSFGATQWQSLVKIKIPLAMPYIKLGVNQTVMMALALVVLATFIGSPGLGDIVWKGLVRLNIGKALEGGLAIVFMAVILDRVLYAIGYIDHSSGVKLDHTFHLFPQSLEKVKPLLYIEYGIDWVWRQFAEIGKVTSLLASSLICKLVSIFHRDLSKKLGDFMLAHSFLVGSCLLLAIMILIDSYSNLFAEFPKQWEYRFRTPVNEFVDRLSSNQSFYAATQGIKTVLYLGLINPLNLFLKGLPWWYTTAIIAGVAYFVSVRSMVIVTVVGMVFIGLTDLWGFAMITLSTVIVSVLICFLIGLPIGVLSAYNKTVDTLCKPVLDTMQTLPVFVYLVPVIMLFGAGQVSAVIATVVYALPPIVRCTTLGIRDLPVEMNEVSTAFGASMIQTLLKVKIPMAVPAIMLGVNQGIMMALAMEVVTPLIGGKGLGFMVFDGMNRANIGISLQAGLGIVLIAIILDRMSQAWTKSQREALGLI